MTEMSVVRALCLSWLAVTGLGCEPEAPPPLGQILLYVDTDAPLPPAPGTTPMPGEAPALFDSLLIDVYEPGAVEPCAGCSRVFALDRTMLQDGGASFGLPSPPAVDGYRARLRLFHSDSTLSAGPPEPLSDGRPPQSVIDLTVALPAPEQEGIVERSVMLDTESVGMPRGSLDVPELTASGRPERSRVGSWPHAQRVACNAAPEPGQVCVPGGAYWMGNPRARGTTLGDQADRRRLVVLRPFFIGATEVTVAEYRAFDDGSQHLLFEWSGDTAGNQWRDYCSFTASPGPHEDKPMLCVSYEGARAYCQAHGGAPSSRRVCHQARLEVRSPWVPSLIRRVEIVSSYLAASSTTSSETPPSGRATLGTDRTKPAGRAAACSSTRSAS